jgi:putative flippase GtrA
VNRASQITLGKYLAIGGFVFCVDAGSFQLLMVAGVPLAVTTTLSYAIGVCTHFTLNRQLNFRNFERSALSQLRTYLVIVFVSYLLTLLIIEVLFRLFAVPPLAGKIAAIVFNIPFGFVCHRYLTFGNGLGHAVRRFVVNRRGSP